jgi:hypothetical protein
MASPVKSKKSTTITNADVVANDDDDDVGEEGKDIDDDEEEEVWHEPNDDVEPEDAAAAVVSSIVPPLDNWQRAFATFISLPSTHRNANTGAPIANRRLNTWGRQSYHHHSRLRRRRRRSSSQDGVGHHKTGTTTLSATPHRRPFCRNSDDDDDETEYSLNVIPMVYMKGNVALSFDTREETIAWADWLAEQRRQYQSRPAPPAPVKMVVDYNDSSWPSSFDHDNQKKKKRRKTVPSEEEWDRDVEGMQETYQYMTGTFRFRLLEQLGIDLTIAPGLTLIDRYHHVMVPLFWPV